MKLSIFIATFMCALALGASVPQMVSTTSEHPYGLVDADTDIMTTPVALPALVDPAIPGAALHQLRVKVEVTALANADFPDSLSLELTGSPSGAVVTVAFDPVDFGTGLSAAKTVTQTDATILTIANGEVFTPTAFATTGGAYAMQTFDVTVYYDYTTSISEVATKYTTPVTYSTLSGTTAIPLAAIAALPATTGAMISNVNQIRVYVEATAASTAERPATLSLAIAAAPSGASISLPSAIILSDFGSGTTAAKMLVATPSLEIETIFTGEVFTPTLTMTGGTPTAALTSLTITIYFDYATDVGSPTALVSKVTPAQTSVCTNLVYSPVLKDTVRDPPKILTFLTNGNLVYSGFRSLDMLDVIVLIHDRYDTSATGSNFNVDLLKEDGVTPVGSDCSAYISPVLLMKTIEYPCYSRYVKITIPWGENKQCGVYTESLKAQAPSQMKTGTAADTDGSADAAAGLRRLRGQISLTLDEADTYHPVDTAVYTTRNGNPIKRVDQFTVMYDVTEDQIAETAKYPRVFAPVAVFEAVADVTATPDPTSLYYTITARIQTSIQWPFILTETTALGPVTGLTSPNVLTADSAEFDIVGFAEVTADRERCDNTVLNYDGVPGGAAHPDLSTKGAASGASDCKQVFLLTLSPKATPLRGCSTVSPAVTLYLEPQCRVDTATTTCPLDRNNLAANVEHFDLTLVSGLDLCPVVTDTVGFTDTIVFYEDNAATTLTDAEVKEDFFEGQSIVVAVQASSSSAKVSVVSADVYKITVQTATSSGTAVTGSTVELELYDQVPKVMDCPQIESTYLSSSAAAGSAVPVDGTTPGLMTIFSHTVDYSTINRLGAHLIVQLSNKDIDGMDVIFQQDASHQSPILAFVADDCFDGATTSVCEKTFDIDVHTWLKTGGAANVLDVIVDCSDDTVDCKAPATIKLLKLDLYTISCTGTSEQPVPASAVYTQATAAASATFVVGTPVVVTQTLVTDVVPALDFNPSVDTAMAVTVNCDIAGINVVPVLYQVFLKRGSDPLMELGHAITATENPKIHIAAGIVGVLQETDVIYVSMTSNTAAIYGDAKAVIEVVYRDYINRKFVTEVAYTALTNGVAKDDYFRLHLDPDTDEVYPSGLFNAPIDEAVFFVVKFYTQVQYDNGLNEGKYYSASTMNLQSLSASHNTASNMQLMSTHSKQLRQATKGFHLQHANEDSAAPLASLTRVRLSSTSLVAVFGGVAMLAVVALAVVVSRRTQAAVVYQALPVEYKV